MVQSGPEGISFRDNVKENLRLSPLASCSQRATVPCLLALKPPETRWLRLTDYSVLSATIGFTRAALRAGSHAARTATVISTAVAPAKLKRS
jgi:hypothetical protein